MLDSTGITRRVIAVANAAGSAGKTTTVVTLAALLAGQGRRVLVVDGDAQGNATEWLGVTVEEGGLDVGDLLMRRASLGEVMIDTNTPGVQIVPASRSLSADLIPLTSTVAGEQRLKAALRPATADVVLIDCPGTITVVTLNALTAADAVITVVQPTMKEMKITELEDTITELEAAYNPGLHLAAVIPCIVPPESSGQLYIDAMRLLVKDYGDLVAPSVRRTVRVPEAHGQSRPLPEHAPKAAATDDYRAVLSWLTARGVL